MKSRKLVLGLLIMLAFVVSSFTYAIWNSVNLDAEVAANTVAIGQGRTGSVAAVLDPATLGQLVPVGFATTSPSADPVEFVVLSFSVTWTDTLATATGVLSASQSNVLIGGVATHIGLLNFTFRIGAGFDASGNPTGTPDASIEDGETVIVYVKITLTLPTTQGEYDDINTENITFTVDFLITE